MTHVAPALGLRCTRPGQWAGKCPVCGGNFTLAVKGHRLAWCCWRKPAQHDKDAIRNALAALLPSCFTVGTKRNTNTVARAELEKLLGLSGAALTLRVACLAWDCSPEEAAARLKMAGRTYRRAVVQQPERGHFWPGTNSEHLARSGHAKDN
ncbi:MAG: hypothetical protein ACLQDY_08300 [Streptosporangiaceae bacterium]